VAAAAELADGLARTLGSASQTVFDNPREAMRAVSPANVEQLVERRHRPCRSRRPELVARSLRRDELPHGRQDGDLAWGQRRGRRWWAAIHCRRITRTAAVWRWWRELPGTPSRRWQRPR
jgi:hypothetical protein